jgi:hypothetical protein
MVICVGLVWLLLKEEQVLEHAHNQQVFTVRGIKLAAIVAYHLQQLYNVIVLFGLLIPLCSF